VWDRLTLTPFALTTGAARTSVPGARRAVVSPSARRRTVTRAFVVVNPAAGNHRTHERWPVLRDELVRAGLTIEVAETTGPGVATKVTRQAVVDGWPLVVAVGGDGTVNEVINGLVDPSGQSLATLAIIATGRGRDVCRNLGITTDTALAVRRLADTAEVSVDLNRAEWEGGGHRYFVNAGGVGFDAEVAERSRVGWGSGTLPYLVAILTTLGRYAPRAATVELDGAVVSRDPVAAVVIANGEYYGGGMRIAPGASPTDGCLNVVVLGDISRVELVRWLPTLYSGRHLENPKVRAYAGKTVTITAPGRLPMHVDGEPVSPAPVRISVCPGALRLRRVGATY
jgi:diacylglycerol kinase (ATP)